MILYSEGATSAQESEAEMILEALTVAYPGHPWGVRVYPGGFFIRHLDFPSNWGMNAKYKEFGYSASALKRDIIMKAGEWLERANLRRGIAQDGEMIGRVDGVPEKWQPPSVKPKLEAEIVVQRAEPRDEPMPQLERP